MRASSRSGGLTVRGTSGPDWSGLGAARDPEAAGRSPDYTRADSDPQLAWREAARGGRKAASSSRRAEAQLLGDDRSVGLDEQRPRSTRDEAAAPGRGRHALGDERIPGRHRPGQAELVLEAEPAGRLGDQVADPLHRPRGGTSSDAGPRLTRPQRASAPLRSGLDRPARRRRPQGRIEVVQGRRRHERLGQLGDPPDEVRAALRVELAEDVVEQEQRRPAVERREQVELGQLEGQDRRPLLAARGEAGQVAAARARRRGRRGAGRSASSRSRPPSRRSRPGAGPGRRWIVSPGAGARSSRSAASAGPPPGRSRDGPTSGSASRLEGARRRRRRRAAAGLEQRVVPEAELVAAGLLLADRPQQAVALLEGPPVGRQVGAVGRRPAGRPAGRARSGAGPASRRRGASPRARTGPSAGRPDRPVARRGTPLTRIRLRWPPVPSRDEGDLDA